MQNFIMAYFPHERNHLFSRPPGHAPSIEVRALRTTVHHEIRRRPAAQRTARGHHNGPAAEQLLRVGRVEEHASAGRRQVGEE